MGTYWKTFIFEQPIGFVDPSQHEHVYKLKKTLYGLIQALACYECLSQFLVQNGFDIRGIDKTAFVKIVNNDFVIVQIYVDDIVF